MLPLIKQWLQVETLLQYKEYLCRYDLMLPQYEEYLCRYNLMLPQYEEYLCRYDVEDHRQSWKLIRVGDFKDK